MVFGAFEMRRQARRAQAVLAIVGVLSTSEVRAEGSPAAAVEMAHDLELELPITLLIAVVGWRLVRDDFEPGECRWCDGGAPGEVNGVDRWFRERVRHEDALPANVTSYALAFGAAPISAAGLTILAAFADGQEDQSMVDVLAITEAGLAAMLVTQTLEFITLRTRPYVHAIADPAEQAALIEAKGAFHSFPAGHVVEVFSLATASGVIASTRGYRLAPLVWTVGLLLGVATAYARIAADRHYFTDTLAGAGIGAAVGVAMPLLFHPNRAPGLANVRLGIAPLEGGQRVALTWTF